MANIVTECIVHKVIKQLHQRSAAIELRPTPLPVSPVVQGLVDQVWKRYAERTGKGYGKFQTDANEFPVQRYINDHQRANGISFVELSNRMMAHLRTRIATEALATGGYVLFAKVTTDGTAYMLVAMVTEVLGTAITSTLDVVPATHLDMEHLRVASRVDLTKWAAGGERYLSFLRGSAEVSEYFKLFIGCDDVRMDAADSRQLVDTVLKFATDQQLDGPARDELLTRTHAYLSGQNKAHEPLSLDALANHAWPTDPQVLSAALTASDPAIPDGFVPDARALRALVRFEGKTRHWRLSFERAALRTGQISFNSSDESLTINNLPAELLAELIEDNGSGNEPV